MSDTKQKPDGLFEFLRTSDGMDVYHNWPVRFAWYTRWGAWKEWFTWHGIEIGAFHFAWTYHLGPLKVIFGEGTAKKYADCWEDGFRVGQAVKWGPCSVVNKIKQGGER